MLQPGTAPLSGNVCSLTLKAAGCPSAAAMRTIEECAGKLRSRFAAQRHAIRWRHR